MYQKHLGENLKKKDFKRTSKQTRFRPRKKLEEKETRFRPRKEVIFKKKKEDTLMTKKET